MAWTAPAGTGGGGGPSWSPQQRAVKRMAAEKLTRHALFAWLPRAGSGAGVGTMATVHGLSAVAHASGGFYRTLCFRTPILAGPPADGRLNLLAARSGRVGRQVAPAIAAHQLGGETDDQPSSLSRGAARTGWRVTVGCAERAAGRVPPARRPCGWARALRPVAQAPARPALYSRSAFRVSDSDVSDSTCRS